jgi:hypothetical protein
MGVLQGGVDAERDGAVVAGAEVARQEMGGMGVAPVARRVTGESASTVVVVGRGAHG